MDPSSVKVYAWLASLAAAARRKEQCDLYYTQLLAECAQRSVENFDVARSS